MVKSKRIRVAVLLGGSSAEREVSITSGKQVIAALKGNKRFTVKAYDPASQLDVFVLALQKKQVDIVFNALHGTGGEDGVIQGFLEVMQVPYTGSGVEASALAMDKYRTKLIYQAYQLPVAKDLLVDKSFFTGSNQNILRRKVKALQRVIIKPVSDGSSVDLVIDPQIEEVPNILKRLLKKHHQLLVEEYIPGRELTVGVLGSSSLPVVEIKPKSGSFTYEAKYLSTETQKLCPAPLTLAQTRKAQKFALCAHQILGCKTYSRTDMILHPKKGLILLETNTLPGLTPMSLLPKAAKQAGIPFDKLIEFLILDALK